jgi:hypothetical protein
MNTTNSERRDISHIGCSSKDTNMASTEELFAAFDSNFSGLNDYNFESDSLSPEFPVGENSDATDAISIDVGSGEIHAMGNERHTNDNIENRAKIPAAALENPERKFSSVGPGGNGPPTDGTKLLVRA